MIIIKNESQISGIKEACSIWKKVRSELVGYIKPGITTKQLDKKAKKLIKSFGAIPTFFKLYGFPCNICISVNSEIIHGIANEYVIKENDMVTCDIGVSYNSYICDAAFTIVVEPSSNLKANKILLATYKSLINSIKKIKPGAYTGDISNEIQKTAESDGYFVIKNYGGHGCGVYEHEDPIILNYGKQHTGVKLLPGMIICIEPMLLIGSDKIKIASNNWTVLSSNNELTCHYEHMVLITKTGYEILTLSEDLDEIMLRKEINFQP